LRKKGQNYLAGNMKSVDRVDYIANLAKIQTVSTNREVICLH